MKWFKLYADLQHHPKRYRFEELADTEYGLHYLTAWFSYVCKFAPTGDVGAFTPREVARACEWKGDPKALWDALVGAGFIEQTEKSLQAHDWAVENSRFIEENSKRKPPKGNPRVTLGLPLLEEKRIEEKRIEKPKTVAVPDGFEEWWSLWPKKDARKGAERSWAKMTPEARKQATEALRWQTKSPDHLARDRQYIPLPTTWLNQERWNDQKESGRGAGKGDGEYRPIKKTGDAVW